VTLILAKELADSFARIAVFFNRAVFAAIFRILAEETSVSFARVGGYFS
jgi:hypothetical protein